MKIWIVTTLLLLAVGVAVHAADVVPTTPTPGPARSIGSAANGCLSGAAALPLSGPGWEVLRPARNRYWGHPAMIAFLEHMAAETAPQGTLLVADIGQPRGGYTVNGHASHQTGLDVDILYRLQTPPLPDAERTDPDLSGVVLGDGNLDPARWGPVQVALLKSFAVRPEVERIFVNPAIKRWLCHAVTGDRAWLQTIRPWYLHEEHFHTRLRCPPGDGDCILGAPLPAGDGCDATLEWWFGPEPYVKGPPAPPKTPPEACRAVLSSRIVPD